jgi:hypothetical protein
VAVDVLRASPIEMRVKLVDDWLTDKVGEKADAERENAAQKHNRESKKLIHIREYGHPRLTGCVFSRNKHLKTELRLRRQATEQHSRDRVQM